MAYEVCQLDEMRYFYWIGIDCYYINEIWQCHKDVSVYLGGEFASACVFKYTKLPKCTKNCNITVSIVYKLNMFGNGLFFERTFKGWKNGINGIELLFSFLITLDILTFLKQSIEMPSRDVNRLWENKTETCRKVVCLPEE